MFKKGETIIYPKYGSTKVSKIYKEEVNGEKYYELNFRDGLAISLPVSKAEEFGMRSPVSKRELQSLLKNVKRIRVSEDDASRILEIAKEKFSTGKAKDVVDLITILKIVSKTRKKNNKTLSLTERDILKDALEFLTSEVEVVLGKKAIEKYALLLNEDER